MNDNGNRIEDTNELPENFANDAFAALLHHFDSCVVDLRLVLSELPFINTINPQYLKGLDNIKYAAEDIMKYKQAIETGKRRMR